MLERSVKLKEFIIALVVVCVLSSVLAHEIGAISDKHQKDNAAALVYLGEVKAYKICVINQKNTKAGNDRGEALRAFLLVAADARKAAAKEFSRVGDRMQAKTNTDAANHEYALRLTVHTARYINCEKPTAPKGVGSAKLPEAPFNQG